MIPRMKNTLKRRMGWRKMRISWSVEIAMKCDTGTIADSPKKTRDERDQAERWLTVKGKEATIPARIAYAR